MTTMKPTIFCGPVVHSEERKSITILNPAAIAVKNGKITAIETSGNYKLIPNFEDYEIIELEKGQFICPGFIDTHIHAPQFPNIGLGYDMPLMDWLKTYTFPLEMRYKDMKFAGNVYKSIITTSLSQGTTTACYYATIHTDSAILLAKHAATIGQRAIVGKVNMNRNSIPEYVETSADSLEETERFINAVHMLDSDLVHPAITPRFAISCDMQLMKDLALLARKYDCYIMTHISENKSEIELVEQLFPDCNSYTEVYEKAGLLTNKTILGHGIYLSEKEKQILMSLDVSIAHCPCSNTLLRSGNCDCRHLIDAGIRVGLGTDVSGGCSTSILDSIRHTLITSLNLSFSKSKYTPLTYHEAFYLATMGGAEALGMKNMIGNFQVGKYFDALIIDMFVSNERAGILAEHNINDWIQKFIYLGDDRNVVKVYVQGKLVKLEK